MPPTYEYLSLKDAYDARRNEVNVYAVVTEWTVPRATKGTDYHVVVKLCDDTVGDILGPDNNGFTDISVNFFAAKDLLPRPKKVGDVIRLHRLKVSQWEGRTQFVAKCGAMTGGAAAGGVARCQYLLFDGAGHEHPSDEPYTRSSNNYTMEEGKDAGFLTRCREFWRDNASVMAMNDSGFTRPIVRFGKEGELTDLHCKVLDVVKNRGKVTLVVWDGSDARPFPPSVNSGRLGDSQEQSQEGVNGGDDEVDAYDAHYWMPADPYAPLTEKDAREDEMIRDTPGIGTALPVVMRQFDIAAEDLPMPGAWIKLRQLASWVRGGQMQATYVHQSKWAPAEPNQVWLEESAKRIEQRRVSQWAPENQIGLGMSQGESQGGGGGGGGGVFGMTRTEFENQPLHTLREIVCTPPPSRHRCVVRVVQHYPKDVHDFCRDGTEDVPAEKGAAANKRKRGLGKKDKEPKFEFNVSLVLEDATGKIKAHLAPPDSDAFFHGIQPCNLWESEVTYARVKDKMTKLTDHKLGTERAGWVQCCVMSYVVPGQKRGDPPKRCYRIFGTSCVA
jgi:hypothetical protein